MNRFLPDSGVFHSKKARQIIFFRAFLLDDKLSWQ